MITAFVFGALLVQQGSLTTPIQEPKHAPPKHASPRKATPNKVVVRDKPVQSKQPVPVQPVFVDRPAGSGNPVKAGDLVTIHFVVSRGNLDLADSKKRGLPYTFKVGERGNDPLLDLVVKGMKVGGTRIAKVTASDVYGPAGAPPIISAKDMLTVKVDLLSRGSR